MNAGLGRYKNPRAIFNWPGDFYNYSFVGKNEALFTFEAVGTGSSMVCIPLVLVLMLILTLSFPS